MAVDVKRLLEAGRYQVPDEDRCAELQTYWDDLTAQAESIGGLGPAEAASRYAAWRPEDD